MKNRLSTTYLGLELQNPVILSSSGFTSTAEKVAQAEKFGVGAVVLKSIFEEQILSEITNIDKYSDYPEAADYIHGYMSENSLNQHLEIISKAKKNCHIPIIASINCMDNGDWTKYAREIQNAGADALELNIFELPIDKDDRSSQIEERYLNIVSKVQDSITIPLTVKMAQGFTNPVSMAKEIYFRGAKGITLFNRFYSPDIDIENLSLQSAGVFSHSNELSNIIRWTGIISSKVPQLQISASTGIHTGKDAIKAILSGASTVQLCTTVYKNGLEVVPEILTFMNDYLSRHNYSSIDQIVGLMNWDNASDSIAYERTQFMKYFSNHHKQF